MGTTEFLSQLCQDLTDNGATSRQLLALEFDAVGKHVNMLVRKEPHIEEYPDLGTIFSEIGRDCDQDGLSPHKLQRILFLQAEIKVALVEDGGQLIIYTYGIVADHLDA